jgi:hypothetical protein
MKTASCVLLCLVVNCGSLAFAAQPSVSPTVELSGEQLRDKIRGGLLGPLAQTGDRRGPQATGGTKETLGVKSLPTC